MALIHDLIELTDGITVDESTAHEFVPLLFLRLGRSCLAACYDLGHIEPELDKVADRWKEVVSGLAKLVQVVRDDYPDSNVLQELMNLHREASEMEAFYRGTYLAR